MEEIKPPFPDQTPVHAQMRVQHQIDEARVANQVERDDQIAQQEISVAMDRVLNPAAPIDANATPVRIVR